MDCFHVYNRWKCFDMVKSWTLGASLSYQLHFVFDEFPKFITFFEVYPFVHNRYGIRRRINKFPSYHIKVLLVFDIHSTLQLWPIIWGLSFLKTIVFIPSNNGINQINVTINDEIALFIQFIRKGIVKSQVINLFPPGSPLKRLFLSCTFPISILLLILR